MCIFIADRMTEIFANLEGWSFCSLSSTQRVDSEQDFLTDQVLDAFC